MASLAGTLLSLLDYDAWATARVLDAAAALSDEQLNRPDGALDRSVRRLLTHAISAQLFWTAQLRGEPRPSTPDPSDAAALRAFAAAAQATFRDFVAGLSEADLDTPFVRGDTTRTWNEQIVQVIEHGIHHRGEVSALLTQHGHSPGDLDYVMFLRERAATR